MTPDVPRHLCRLMLTIDGTGYTLRRLSGGWLLTKTDGAAYAVIATASGPVCSCPDARHRHRRCKHVGGVLAAGLPVG